MKVFQILSVLLYILNGISGFILDDFSTTKGLTATTPAQPNCKIDVFENCTNDFTSLVNVTGNGDVTFDRQGLLDFYCGTGVAESIQCLRDNLDPTCGPNTDAAVINSTLSNVPPNFSYDKVCRNATDYNELLSCQLLLPNIQGYIDCITGETLNKTLDPTDTCKFFESTLGCSYKYTELMCPDSIGAFKENAKSTGNCNPDFENSQEASACDENMQEACSVAYKPPSMVNSSATEIANFICSKRSLEYQWCLRKVFELCKDKNGFDFSSISSGILQYETQTALYCSDDKEIRELTKCQSMFPKLSAFQECVTGKTLNETIDPADQCRFLKNSVGCSYKYTDLMCPEDLDIFNKTVAIPPNCPQDIDLIKTVTTCDNNTDQACSAAYNPPTTNDPEEYVEFICTRRAKGYTTCLQKVHTLCHSTNIDVSALLKQSQSSENQTEIICADKTSYKAFAKCLTSFVVSNEYTKCASTVASTNACSIHVCNLNSIKKTCPTSEQFYKKLNYDALVECNFMTASGTLVIPMVSSSSSSLQLSMLTFIAAILNAFVRFI
ncbi:uncharacterized protein LOC123553467 [Mercenaria mercenaria]|uniref:uncharacterized protein LOC123553467 n=1 Tax=Mercenaria mercenaria TaxID=6596 RepID=UPI00234E5DDC|nr:uncharacterized protein LOC123553467 [Mercenaria mercenaria]